MTAALTRSFTAVNPPGARNRVHDDEFAASLGFAAGLVPGVDLYAQLAELPFQAWGERWVAEGGMAVRFLKPVYDGEVVTCTATPSADGNLDLELRNPRGLVCARGAAACPAGDPPQARPEDFPAAPLPAAPGPPAFAEGAPLGTLVAGLELRDHAWPARLGNEVLVANADLPPWMHIESRVRHFGPPVAGEAVSVRGRVAAAFERRGHRFVDADLLVLGSGSRPLARLRHVAIVELAQLRAR